MFAMVSPSAIAPAGTEAAERVLSAFLRGRSTNTLRAYRDDLAEFAAHCGAVSPGLALARILSGANGEANALALDWRHAMEEAGLSPASINRRLAAVRSCVKLARMLGVVTWQLDIPGVKARAYRDTKGPGLLAIRAMLEAATAQRNKVKAVRDVALLRLLFDLGLRRAEVTALEVSDLDLSAGRVLVLGKGQREKVALTLPQGARLALAAWLEVRGFAAGPLFVNLDRRSSRARLTGAGLYDIVSKLGAKAGAQVRPHGIRHTAITAALDATRGDVRRVRAFSRHANVQTLLVYDDARNDHGGAVAASVAALLD
jgi:integrase/recombinase XerC